MGRHKNVSKPQDGFDPVRARYGDAYADLPTDDKNRLYWFAALLRGPVMDQLEPKKLVNPMVANLIRWWIGLAQEAVGGNPTKLERMMKALVEFGSGSRSPHDLWERPLTHAMLRHGDFERREIYTTEAFIRSWLRANFPGLLRPNDRSKLNVALKRYGIVCKPR